MEVYKMRCVRDVYGMMHNKCPNTVDKWEGTDAIVCRLGTGLQTSKRERERDRE